MRKALTLLVSIFCLMVINIVPAAAYSYKDGLPCFTSGINNDYAINLYGGPIVLKSINLERTNYDSYSTYEEKSSFSLFAPGDGDYTFTVTAVTPTGYRGLPQEVIFHFIERDYALPSNQWETGREFVFRYHPGKTERFTIPDCADSYGYELYILPKEGSTTSLECYAYLSVCFDGYHVSGEITALKEPASCGKEGTRYIGCSLCQTVTATQVIPALSHEMEAYQVIVPAACVQEGQVGSVCKHCGLQEDVRNVGKAGHTPGYTVTSETGHNQEGSYEIRCADCNTLMSSGSIPTNSQHVPVLKITSRPTCTEAGSYKLICEKSSCEEVFSSGTIPATGHHYISSWANEDSQDYLEADSWLFHASICFRCGDKHTFIFPSLIVLCCVAVVLLILVIILSIVLRKVHQRRRYRLFIQNNKPSQPV